MGEVILTTNLKREPGFLYYCSTDKSIGTITVCRAVMLRGRKKKKE